MDKSNWKTINFTISTQLTCWIWCLCRNQIYHLVKYLLDYTKSKSWDFWSVGIYDSTRHNNSIRKSQKFGRYTASFRLCTWRRLYLYQYLLKFHQTLQRHSLQHEQTTCQVTVISVGPIFFSRHVIWPLDFVSPRNAKNTCSMRTLKTANWSYWDGCIFGSTSPIDVVFGTRS